MNHREGCKTPVVSHDLCAECHDPICAGDEMLTTVELYNGAPRRYCGDCYVDRCPNCGDKLKTRRSQDHEHGSYDNGYRYCSDCEYSEAL